MVTEGRLKAITDDHEALLAKQSTLATELEHSRTLHQADELKTVSLRQQVAQLIQDRNTLVAAASNNIAGGAAKLTDAERGQVRMLLTPRVVSP